MVRPNDHLWALVLGGSSGLGLATAKKLASKGYHLIIVHRDRRTALPAIEEQMAEIKAMGVECHRFNSDATDASKQKEILEQLLRIVPIQQLRVLVHSIAKGNLKPMNPMSGPALDPGDLQLTIQAMAISLYEWVRQLNELQLFAPDSRVVAFTSEGSHRAWPAYGAVAAAKATLESIVRQIALEFAPSGIKANCIQAGTTITPAFELIPGYRVLQEQALHRNPHKRLTQPEDVANAVYLLTLDEAKWITGTVLPVDGGEHLR